MIKLYIKQAFSLLKQNKLFSGIYIIGTGLAIAMVMVLVVIYYIKFADIYPETNRSRIITVRQIKEKDKGNNTFIAPLSYRCIKEMFYTLETPETVSGVSDSYYMVEYPDGELVNLPVMYTDADFWKVFSFSFLKGKPYSEEEFRSGMSEAVVSASFAKKVFGEIDVIGKRMKVNFRDVRICGVVKDASFATSNSFSQIWLPYTCLPNYEMSWGSSNYIGGGFKVHILMRSGEDYAKVADEINQKFHKASNSQDKYTLSVIGNPDKHWENALRESSDGAETNVKKILINSGLICLLLLLVPAVNLSGMISSRMEKRTSEMGIRKVFGASRSSLLNQILYENLFLTCLGGLLGLLFCYVIILFSHNWILNLMDAEAYPIPDGVSVQIMPSMLFNPVVFIITFCICLLLNILSALLPAWKSLRKNIMDSLNSIY